jgi:sugar phosphate isomerase/epimerase
MNERQFIRQFVMLAAAVLWLLTGCRDNSTYRSAESPATSKSTATLNTSPTPYFDTIGLQLWTVREQLAEDPKATLRSIAELGYYQVELMDTRQAEKLLPICQDLGLAVHSSFMQWTAITGRWDLVPDEKTAFSFDEVLDQANEAGLSHLVFGYLQPGEREKLDDYKRLADQLNEAALKAQKRGLQMAYHNHNFEFEQMEGQLPFHVLAERLDATLMPFELDVFWAAVAGQDPVELLSEIKGRVKLLHLKDLKRSADITTVMEDVPNDAFQELGDGSLPIRKLIEMGKEFGVDYCFVEQDESPAPFQSITKSLNFLRG